jgi:hypothetical protein
MIGAIGWGSVAQALSVCGIIHPERLHARRLQTSEERRNEPLHHFIADARIGLALVAQALAVERNGASQFDRARVE